MRYSKIFGKTVKKPPSDQTAVSAKLLHQAGFVRESVAGRYFMLPLGMRVTHKIMQIIKEEMDKAGAQEMLSPVLHPIELWKETNRTSTAGFELMRIKDRRGVEFALGGTAEEMFVDVVRKFQLSYRDLPFNIYQFSSKFRDEMRVKGGLLRVREFTMKDGYSFHVDADDFKREYKNMENAYSKIFERIGLKTYVVESDNGYIGGEYCHEFIVESEAGESKFLITEDGKYASHEEVAKFYKDKKNLDEKLQPLKEVKAERGPTMEDGVKLHKMPLWQQIKDVLYVDEKGRFILAIIRGDYDVNEVKLKNIVKALELRYATEDEIRGKLHSEPGFISPVGIKDIKDKDTELIIVSDDSLRTIKNAYGGANKKHLDLFNVNIDRDYKPDIEGDIAMAKAGYLAIDGQSKLIEKRGIEVGNIFQLGLHYSTRMRDANFIDKDGKAKPYYMGCYGIGVGRTLATVVEIHHDDRGIIWPRSVAPFQVHLVALDPQDKKTTMMAEDVYNRLNKAGVEVLFDDRIETSAGEKFADADLIGIPLRFVVSKRNGDLIEVKKRNEKDSVRVAIDRVLDLV